MYDTVLGDLFQNDPDVRVGMWESVKQRYKWNAFDCELIIIDPG